MEYHSTHIIKGYDFGHSVGYKSFAKQVRVSIYTSTGYWRGFRFFAFDDKTGANITSLMSAIGSATMSEALDYTGYILMCYGGSNFNGAIWGYLKEMANKSFARSNKKLTFIELKLIDIIK